MVEGDVDGLLSQPVVRKAGVSCESVWPCRSGWSAFRQRLCLATYVVVEGLGHPVEEEPGADSTGKQHGEPCKMMIGQIFLLVRFGSALVG